MDTFDTCSSTNSIAFATVGPVSLTLNSTAPNYYTCAFGQHCSLGQKLSIYVLLTSSTPTTRTPSPAPLVAPTPTPTPTTTTTPSPSRHHRHSPPPSSAPSPSLMGEIVTITTHLSFLHWSFSAS
ncbi:PREDICTED: blue copper protein-like [Erythranthe guttata]|nr:PREDICTED: blue copper protein-like [Erythranthe guttata]|eukprot:XP_012840276.1 PREDICTED: blue copper protein-like [Erythranthe guttata]